MLRVRKKQITAMPLFPTRPIELVTIANDNCLLPRMLIQHVFDSTFLIAGENARTHRDKRDPFDRRRTQRIYINPLGIKTNAGNPYIQKVRLGFIDSNGNSHRWGSDFSEKMYLHFTNIKSDEALDRFIQKTGFCVFPSEVEVFDLRKEYEKKEIKFPRLFLPGQETTEKRNRDSIKIVGINKQFILKKKEELRFYVDQHKKGTLRYDQLLWINKQVENVSNILIDGKHFIWKEIVQGTKGKTIKDSRNLKEVLGIKEIRGMSIIPALRAYGHYAYCCYEFFLDVLEKNAVLTCKNCDRYFNPDRKGQFFCKEPSCVRSRNSKNKLNI